MMSTLYQKWQTPVFLKSFKFHQDVVQILNVWREFKAFNVRISNGNMKEFSNVKFAAKIDVPIGYFMLPLLMQTSEA